MIFRAASWNKKSRKIMEKLQKSPEISKNLQKSSKNLQKSQKITKYQIISRKSTKIIFLLKTFFLSENGFYVDIKTFWGFLVIPSEIFEGLHEKCKFFVI